MHDMMGVGATVEDVMRGKYLTFRVGDLSCGIEINYIKEIISVQEVTLVPHTHDYVKGIINLRGTVVPVIDMNMRFSGPEIVYTEQTCIIVLVMDEMTVGILVDGVQDVLDIADEDIQDPPKATGSAVKNEFIKAVGMAAGVVTQLIDINTVFEMHEEE